MPVLKTLPDRLRQICDIRLRPGWGLLRDRAWRALAGRLAGEDGENKTAIVIGDGEALVRHLGLARVRITRLPYPDFTLDTLALLSDEYDFIITDRMLHLSDALDDAAHETIRVLKPGGWFVHTGSVLDYSIHGNLDRRRWRPAGLRTLFPQCNAEAGGSPLGNWVIGRKNLDAPPLDLTMNTRRAPWRWYRCAPRAARFGVAAIVRNEAPYLLEWIAYYRVLGFEQFLIYDNLSTDASARILAPLARAGIINVRRWSDRHRKQRKAYNHALRRLRGLVEWCFFVDLDEFLVLDPGLTITDLLPAAPDACCVFVPWRFIGSGDARNRGPELTIERFLMGSADNHRAVKSLVRLSMVKTMDVHGPASFKGRVLDLEGNDQSKSHTGWPPVPTGGPARLHHYFTRSYEEFTCKRLRGTGVRPGKQRPPAMFDSVGPGSVEIRDALPLAPAVKAEADRLRAIVGRH